ncbi:hypothetical protein B0T24DRAFT_109326 [Lasiosphaeria ovina]|uniref:SnoaL-like domain-containing protein n=1 Tax=Lasiosphaeria ovina TaxID=92902 RepID=A0AAE0JUM9_9PEZI|nr:hypothetical protein B0T24DRAFT_109326 [Lasiosphaeria ovina]
MADSPSGIEIPPSSARMRTVRALLDGYSSLSVEQLLAPLSDDFGHWVLPASLGMPARTKDDFALHACGIFSIFDEFRMVPQAIFEDVAQGVVVVHARMEGALKGRRRQNDRRRKAADAAARAKAKGREQEQEAKTSGGGDGDWTNECVIMVRLSPDGEKIVEIQEFVDSVKATEMRRRHAPKHFFPGGDRLGSAAVVGNVLLFSCLAAGTFYGVRRMLQ